MIKLIAYGPLGIYLRGFYGKPVVPYGETYKSHAKPYLKFKINKVLILAVIFPANATLVYTMYLQPNR